MKRWYYIIALLFFFWHSGIAQCPPDVQYRIVQMEFNADYDVIKIKVPPWLKTHEVMEQIRLAVRWPGEPPPKKKVIVYVFRECDTVGTPSATGAVYLPEVGFLWALKDWHPQKPDRLEPSQQEIGIYNAYMDSILSRGATLDNLEVRRDIARQFRISPSRLDSIYLKVKCWWYFRQKEKNLTHR